MNFKDTFMNGEQGLFKPSTLTPMQKLVLRFVVIGLIYYGFAVVEGMIMRMYQISPIAAIPDYQYFAILTAHPLVGIFGSTYSIVFGAFLFLVPFLMKKPLWSFKLANWTSILIGVGTLIFWLAGFFTHYAPLYTLYWPLPADFSQFNPLGGTFFVAGAFLGVAKVETIKHKVGLLFVVFLVILVALHFNVYDATKHVLLSLFVLLFGLIALYPISKINVIGDLSYGIYIYGFPIQQTLMYYFKLNTNTLILFSVLIAMLFGYFSWHLIEKRMLVFKNKF